MLLETRCVYAQCFFKDGTYLASSNYLFKQTLHTIPNILPYKMILRRRSFTIWGIGCFLIGFALCTPIQAQTRIDSLALLRASWDTLESHQGLIISKASIRLFDSDQQIYRMDVDPKFFSLQPIQNTKRQKVKRLGIHSHATAAVNGGYFVTKTRKAIACYFLKIQDTITDYTGGLGTAAIAMDSSGTVHFLNDLPQIASQDSLWHRSYPNVLSAGPMLVYNGRQLFRSPQTQDKRHPRTIIGMHADSTLTFLVIDGRQKGADGMSRVELAWTCHMLGMQNALNLDGGGSSTLWSQQRKTVNRPSDRIAFIRIPRKVANAILILPKTDQ